MILQQINFAPCVHPIIDRLSRLFSEANADEWREIMDCVHRLSTANFRCYQANMAIIELRKSISERMADSIADEEWQARSVGEIRVAAKARINRLISDAHPAKANHGNEFGSIDDVVLSVGEMIDRLTIEYIKRTAYSLGDDLDGQKTRQSQEWSRRVWKHLDRKIDDIAQYGYECLDESRTYDLSGLQATDGDSA